MPSSSSSSAIVQFRVRLVPAALLLIVLAAVASTVTATTSDDCHQAESLLCHGVRMVRSVANMKPMRLVEGVEIVRIPSSSMHTTSERSRSTGNGYVDRVVQYLEQHEIKISVQDLMKGSGVVDVFGRALKEVESENEVVEARKKDKGGLSTVLITALMMKKMLAALGMGAIAALAAKALGIALLALLLSSLLGLKKLSEPSHDVQYVHGDHHRKRREVDEDVPLPYRGWVPAMN